MKEKNNTILKILLVIFIILTICLSGYIVYDKVLSNNEKEIKEENNNLKDSKNNTLKEEEETSTLPAWIDYLLSYNDLSITLKKNYESEDPTTSYDIPKEKTLTKEESKEYLLKLNSCEITNYYIYIYI